MSENDRQRRSAVGIRSILKILTIVVVTVALTVLCVRSGQSMTKTPDSTITVYPTNDNGKMAHDNVIHDNRQKINDGGHISEEIVNATDRSTTEEQERVWFNSRPNSTWLTAEKQLIKNHSTVKHPLQVNSRSLKTGMIQDERQIINEPLIPKSRATSFDPRGKLVESNWYSANNHKNGNDHDVEYNKINQRQMNYYDSSNIETDERDDGSTDTYSTYNVKKQRYNQAYNPIRVNILNKDAGSELDYQDTNVYGSPYYGLQGSFTPIVDNKPLSNNNYQPSINTDINKYPSVPIPQEKVLNVYDKMKVDWKTMSIMALIKLGLVKIKAFGIINFLLFLLFKLKFVLFAAFFKILLILKFVKFFKILVLSPILPILTTLLFSPLFSIPRLILNSVIRPINVPATQPPAPNTSPNMLPSTNQPSQQPNTPSNRPSALPTTRPATSRFILTTTNNNQKDLRDLKASDLNLSGERRHKQFESFDPTSDIFQKLLDSEKCVERIACRMATANQAGIINSWINWILSDASKVIPKENLDVYFKTYDDVKNATLTSSLTPDSWATWCLKRYNCNDSTNATDVTDTRQ